MLKAHGKRSQSVSHSLVSDSLRPHGLQHTRPPCPSPTPRVYSNSYPLSRWCHAIISSSVIPFSYCLQSFPLEGCNCWWLWHSSLLIWQVILHFSTQYSIHNKLWNVLREMGISDQLTYLLRNLYAGQETTVTTRHGTTDWFKIGKGEWQGCTLPPCLFNFYAEYIIGNAGLDESQAESKLPGKISTTSYM